MLDVGVLRNPSLCPLGLFLTLRMRKFVTAVTARMRKFVTAVTELPSYWRYLRFLDNEERMSVTVR
jgi:hypothetical protein